LTESQTMQDAKGEHKDGPGLPWRIIFINRGRSVYVHCEMPKMHHGQTRGINEKHVKYEKNA